MMRRLWQKVEYVRSQPEAVRKRYVMACLSLSMVFIVGMWILTLRESVANARQDREQAQEMMPEAEVPSLTELLEKAAPLSVEKESPLSGEEYFNEELRREPVSGGLEGEGVGSGRGENGN